MARKSVQKEAQQSPQQVPQTLKGHPFYGLVLDEQQEKFRDAMKLVKPGEKGRLSKGGMDSKLKAVKEAVESGIDTYIANGRRKVIAALLDGKSAGTFFPGETL